MESWSTVLRSGYRVKNTWMIPYLMYCVSDRTSIGCSAASPCDIVDALRCPVCLGVDAMSGWPFWSLAFDQTKGDVPLEGAAISPSAICKIYRRGGRPCLGQGESEWARSLVISCGLSLKERVCPGREFDKWLRMNLGNLVRPCVSSDLPN